MKRIAFFLIVLTSCSGKPHALTITDVSPTCKEKAIEAKDIVSKSIFQKQRGGEANSGTDRGGEFSTSIFSNAKGVKGEEVEVTLFGSNNFQTTSGYWSGTGDLLAVEVTNGNTVQGSLKIDSSTTESSIVAIEAGRPVGLIQAGNFACPGDRETRILKFIEKVRERIRTLKGQGRLEIEDLLNT